LKDAASLAVAAAGLNLYFMPLERKTYRVASLGALLLLALTTRQVIAIPADDLLKSLKPTSDVNDFAHLLTPAEKASLEARCRQLRDRTGAQLAVVTLKSLQGGQIDDFSVELFKQWGIGEKKDRNGILLLVVIDDRKARIETGYDIEPIIPDMLTVRILESKLAPQFRDKQFAAGLNDTVAAITELVVKGEPADRDALANQRPADWFTTVLFLCIFIGFGGFAIGLGLGIPQIGMAMFGLFFGGMATALGYGVGGKTSLAIHLPLGVLAAIAGFALAKKGGGGPGGGRRYTSPGTGWNWGSFPTSSGGWSGGGWSSGGGGFSQDWGGFGGGSSGGGGGSISW
jgi:uncharacterized protein